MLKKYTTAVIAFCSLMVSTSVEPSYSPQHEAFLKRDIQVAAS
jgi:hypothetical protein